jgi:hypothetical protein
MTMRKVFVNSAEITNKHEVSLRVWVLVFIRDNLHVGLCESIVNVCGILLEKYFNFKHMSYD